MKNPFSTETATEKENRQHAENLKRWSRMAPETSKGAIMADILKTQPREVQKVIGKEIEGEWTRTARNSGQLFPIHEKDSTGHDTVRYEGDIKAAFESCHLPSVPITIAKPVFYKGEPYLHPLPPDVIRGRLLQRNGFSPD